MAQLAQILSETFFLADMHKPHSLLFWFVWLVKFYFNINDELNSAIQLIYDCRILQIMLFPVFKVAYILISILWKQYQLISMHDLNDAA